MALQLALLASCSDGGKPTDVQTSADTGPDTSSPTEEKDRLDELGAKDFGGRTFRILDANSYPSVHVNMPGESMNGDIVNDALYERDMAISDRYNINIKYEQADHATTGCNTLKKSVLAGDDAYSLCISCINGGALEKIAVEGVLANLSDNPYISLEAEWWSRLIYENLNLDGRMFFTMGDISPTMYQTASCMYLNTALAEDYGVSVDEICALVRNGKWTLDAVGGYTKDLSRDMNDDGVMSVDNDFFGLINSNTSLDVIACCAGVKTSELSADKKNIIVDMLNDSTLKVIDKVRDITIPKIKYSDQVEIITKAFKEGRALMLYQLTEGTQLLRDMEDDYLLLPAPKGSEAQSDYHSYVNSWANAYIAIPETSDPEFAGFITEALDFWSYKYTRPKAYDLTYKQKTARDENSAGMLDIIFDTLCIDFNYIKDFGGSYNALKKVLDGKGELASEMDSLRSKIDSDIEKYVSGWKTGTN